MISKSPLLVFALAVISASAMRLSGHILRGTVGEDPVGTLSQDAFFKQWWPTGPTPEAKTVLKSGSDGWQGHGLQPWLEFPMWKAMERHVPQDATIMEIGARFGTTTCQAAQMQGNSGRLVVVEPDAEAHGALMANLKSHNCHARVMRGVLGSRPMAISGSGYGERTVDGANSTAAKKVPNFEWDAVEKASGMKFDTLVMDCEGCLEQVMDQIGPKLKSQINTFVLEGDFDCEFEGTPSQMKGECLSYEKTIDTMAKNGLKLVEKRNDCYYRGPPANGCPSGHPSVNFYVFGREA